MPMAGHMRLQDGPSTERLGKREGRPRKGPLEAIGRVLRGPKFGVYGWRMNETVFTDVDGWRVLHEEIRGLARSRAANERAMGRALLRAHRDGGWRQLGVATFIEYAERFAGLTPRQTEDRLRVAFALERLPATDLALARGELPFTAVRELCRVMEPDTEAEWLTEVEGRTVGEIQQLVSGREPGDLPEDPPRARRHRLSFEVSPEVYALVRDAQAKVRAQAGGSIEDEDVLRTMARAVLEGPGDEGRSSYQIAVSLCSSCGTASQDGSGEAVTIDETALETAACDAQHLDEKGHATQDVPPATRRLVMRRQHGKCGVPGCRLTTWIDVHHLQFRSEGGTHDERNLLGLCTMHHAAVHRGALWIEGTWKTGLKFSHADGTVYGALVDPGAAAVLADVHRALVGLGFKDREARARVARIKTHVGALGSLEAALRAALAQGV
jgi:hypothetical protein